MTKHRAFFLTFTLGLGLALLPGCGGDDTTTTGALDASSVSNAADTFNALEGLLNTVDSSSAQGKLSASSRGQATNGPAVGDKSFTGCHVNAGKNRMLRNIKMFRDPLCHISQAEKSNSGFVVPEDNFAYYSILGAGEESDQPFLIRIKRYTNDGGFKCLNFQACKEGSQSEDFQFCNVDAGVEARVSHAFSDTAPDGTVHQGKGSIGLTAHGTDLENVTDATVSSEFNDTFGDGSSTLTLDGTALTYNLSGFFGGTFSDFSNETGMCAEGGQGIGSAHVVSDATFPPFYDPIADKYFCPNTSDPFSMPVEVTSGDVCSGTFDQIESFQRVPESDPASFTIIDNADSPFYADVVNCAVPTEATAPSDFETPWDCTAPDGFTTIDASNIDFSECQKIQEEIRQGDQEERSCEQESLQ
ncbi:MAG TPA: hypothetical protein VI895_14490 [Bdellovibrionota bacterium]|nr:hypothetical protein [Bdellovibrionota bacterium]